MLLEGIETLLVLSKEKTMSRTGSQLYITQSAVSKRIANLEKKLGKKLIEPQGRHIRLTAEAEALIQAIAPSFNELCGQIYDQQPLQDNTLIRLDCSETLVSGYVSKLFPSLLAQDPYLTITTNHTPRIIEHVKSGKATMGISAGYLPPNHGLLTFHLGDEPFFIISQQPLLQLPKQVITNDLSNPANSYLIPLLNQHGISPVMEMDSYTAAAQLALHGSLPALIPQSIVQAMKIPTEHCYQFSELSSLIRPIHISVRHNAYRSARVEAVITAMSDAVATAVLAPSAST